jgi:sugar O-acyltransferase (sialic acid O-acetyltransferase NeuD family)
VSAAVVESLVILGTGGSSHDVLDIVEAINVSSRHWRVLGFLDDGRARGSHHLGFAVLGPLVAARQLEDCLFVNTIGSDRNYQRRADIVASTGLNPARFATLIHPAASVSSRARLGRGIYVSHGVSIGGGACVGDHVSFCPGAIVGHDARVEDGALIAPGAIISGFVHLGQSCYIGAGAVVRQHLRIGDKALVGMGAVVVRDVEAGTRVVGNPARLLPSVGHPPA